MPPSSSAKVMIAVIGRLQPSPLGKTGRKSSPSTEVKTIRSYFLDHETEIAGSVVPAGYPVEDTEVLLLDDLGYIQQSPEEAEVLFTLLAERYERRSILLTSNLVFGQWDRIFRDQMATAAAIDRLVHHAGREPSDSRELFGTPHGLTFESAAALFGLAYHRAMTTQGFIDAYRTAGGRASGTLIRRTPRPPGRRLRLPRSSPQRSTRTTEWSLALRRLSMLHGLGATGQRLCACRSTTGTTQSQSG